MADDSAEIVELRPGFDAEDDDRPLKSVPRPSPYCSHYRTELRSEERRVYCRDCGREIPAFDVLQTLARSHERWINQRREAERRAKVAAAALEALSRRERNAKARVRGWVGKCPECVCEVPARYYGARPPFCSECGGRMP